MIRAAVAGPDMKDDEEWNRWRGGVEVTLGDLSKRLQKMDDKVTLLVDNMLTIQVSSADRKELREHMRAWKLALLGACAAVLAAIAGVLAAQLFH